MFHSDCIPTFHFRVLDAARFQVYHKGLYYLIDTVIIAIVTVSIANISVASYRLISYQAIISHSEFFFSSDLVRLELTFVIT